MAGWAGKAAGSRQRRVDEHSGCTCASCSDSVLSRPEGWVIDLQCSVDDPGGGGGCRRTGIGRGKWNMNSELQERPAEGMVTTSQEFPLAGFVSAAFK